MATRSLLAAAGLLLLGVALGAATTALLSRRRDATQRRRRLTAPVLLVVVGLLGVIAVGLSMDPRLAQAASATAAARFVSTFPDFVLAVLVLVAAIIVGVALRDFVERMIRPVRQAWAVGAGVVAYWLVITIAVVVGARQVGVAVGLVEALVVVGVGGFVLAVAVGLGLGSGELLSAIVAGRHVATIIDVGDEIEIDGIRGTVLALGQASARMAVGDVVVEVPNGRFLKGVAVVHRRGGTVGDAGEGAATDAR